MIFLIYFFFKFLFPPSPNRCASLLGQEENLFAKKNYEKYLSALKDSGLVYMEDKGQGASSDVAVGAEGGAGAMVLLGKRNFQQDMKFSFPADICIVCICPVNSKLHLLLYLEMVYCLFS